MRAFAFQSHAALHRHNDALLKRRSASPLGYPGRCPRSLNPTPFRLQQVGRNFADALRAPAHCIRIDLVAPRSTLVHCSRSTQEMCCHLLSRRVGDDDRVGDHGNSVAKAERSECLRSCWRSWRVGAIAMLVARSEGSGLAGRPWPGPKDRVRVLEEGPDPSPGSRRVPGVGWVSPTYNRGVLKPPSEPGFPRRNETCRNAIDPSKPSSDPS